MNTSLSSDPLEIFEEFLEDVDIPHEWREKGIDAYPAFGFFDLHGVHITKDNGGKLVVSTMLIDTVPEGDRFRELVKLAARYLMGHLYIDAECSLMWAMYMPMPVSDDEESEKRSLSFPELMCAIDQEIIFIQMVLKWGTAEKPPPISSRLATSSCPLVGWT